jgi:hypothetical protein
MQNKSEFILHFAQFALPLQQVTLKKDFYYGSNDNVCPDWRRYSAAGVIPLYFIREGSPLVSFHHLWS